MFNQKQSLTQGSIVTGILYFAIPIFLGNLFQQLYNTADSLIVGNYLGDDALAAVSSSGSLIFFMVGFFYGIAVGAGVIISKYFGARDYNNLRLAIHTNLAFSLLSGIVLTFVGINMAPVILELMNTPEDVLPNSVAYFRVYFMGAIALVLYNTCTGILQALGDSKHPLIYLIISSCINIVLDFLFVGVLHKGVEYAAFATVIAQFISALLCVRKLTRLDSAYRLSIREIRFDERLLRQIISLGLPSGFQNSVISIANIVVQANINKFGDIAMAGSGSYFKIEGYGFLPVTCFAMAMTTFIGQNLGAKQYNRAKKGARFGLIVSPLLAELVGLIIYIFAPVLIASFGCSSEAIEIGVLQCRTECLFYCMLAFAHCVAGVMRGAGLAKVPMYIMMGVWCFLRITYITIMVKFIPKIVVVFWAYPLTWGISCIIFLIYYLKSDWLHNFD